MEELHKSNKVNYGTKINVSAYDQREAGYGLTAQP